MVVVRVGMMRVVVVRVRGLVVLRVSVVRLTKVVVLRVTVMREGVLRVAS